jgi:hypothetical protein
VRKSPATLRILVAVQLQMRKPAILRNPDNLLRIMVNENSDQINKWRNIAHDFLHQIRVDMTPTFPVKMKPRASAPAAMAICASSLLVTPHIFIRVLLCIIIPVLLTSLSSQALENRPRFSGPHQGLTNQGGVNPRYSELPEIAAIP